MALSFSQIISSPSHYIHPFSYPRRQALTRSQKINVLALTVIFGLLTLGIGVPIIFYISSAIYKARNSRRVSAWPTFYPILTRSNGRSFRLTLPTLLLVRANLLARARRARQSSALWIAAGQPARPRQVVVRGSVQPVVNSRVHKMRSKIPVFVGNSGQNAGVNVLVGKGANTGATVVASSKKKILNKGHGGSTARKITINRGPLDSDSDSSPVSRVRVKNMRGGTPNVAADTLSRSPRPFSRLTVSRSRTPSPQGSNKDVLEIARTGSILGRRWSPKERRRPITRS